MTAISSDVIRGYNDTMILFLLRNKSSYGYEISKDIKALSEEKYIIKETTLYSAFTRWKQTVMWNLILRRLRMENEEPTTALPIRVGVITKKSVKNGTLQKRS